MCGSRGVAAELAAVSVLIPTGMYSLLTPILRVFASWFYSQVSLSADCNGWDGGEGAGTPGRRAAVSTAVLTGLMNAA